MSGPEMLLRIATRASRLALWQAEHVAALIRASSPECTVELVHVTTTGDRDQTEPLISLGGWGIFTREVQKAVLDGRADVAVHSLKDLPTVETPGLLLAAIPVRGDTADALVFPASRPDAFSFAALNFGSRVGTGSLRRRAQLLYIRPDLELVDVRGNVETRLRKLDDHEYDALLLAVAGLARLDLHGRVSLKLTAPIMYAAVGQGALGIECRADDAKTAGILAKLDDHRTHRETLAERTLLSELRAGCHAPVGVHTLLSEALITVQAVVLSPDGHTRIEAEMSGPPDTAAEVGRQTAAELIRLGARSLIDNPPAG